MMSVSLRSPRASSPQGGQARLEPSPVSFFVASMPSLLPMAISLVTWSSTSAGPLVKMLSRCASARGARASRPQVPASRRNHLLHAESGWRDANQCDRDGRAPHFYFLNSVSIFFRVASSIRINGGQPRLWPSLGSFFVASMPNLLPMAISLATWSSTSTGSRDRGIKISSRLRLATAQ